MKKENQQKSLLKTHSSKKCKIQIYPNNPSHLKTMEKAKPNVNWDFLLYRWRKPLLLERTRELYLNSENKYFILGLEYEYGLNGCSQNFLKAYKFYEDGALNHTDTLSMYRMYRIHLKDFKDFGIKQDSNLEYFFFYKAYCFSTIQVINFHKYFFGQFDITQELEEMLKEDPSLEILNKLLDYLTDNNIYNIPIKDIQVIRYVMKKKFLKEDLKALESEIINHNNIEGIYKVGCFALKDNPGLAEILFKLCFENKYFRICGDYGSFLFSRNKQDNSLPIVKAGYENGELSCYYYYYDNYLFVNALKGIFDKNSKISLTNI